MSITLILLVLSLLGILLAYHVLIYYFHKEQYLRQFSVGYSWYSFSSSLFYLLASPSLPPLSLSLPLPPLIQKLNFSFSVVFGLMTIAAQQNAEAIMFMGTPIRLSFLPFASLILTSLIVAHASFIVCMQPLLLSSPFSSPLLLFFV